MNDFCLYLQDDNGEYFQVDLDAGRNILLNYQRSDFQSFGSDKNKANFANNITLLGTPRTLTAFQHFYRFDLTESQGLVDKTFNALLTFEGVDIMEGIGQLRIKRVKYDAKDECLTFRCFLTGGAKVWRDLAEQTRYRDLNVGFHFKSAANVEDSWTAPRTRYNGVYLPVDRGSWYEAGMISVFDLEYAPYIKSVVEGFFSSIGWNVRGKEWWDVFAERLVLPPSIENFAKTNSEKLPERGLELGVPGSAYAAENVFFEPGIYRNENLRIYPTSLPHIFPVPNADKFLWSNWDFRSNELVIPFDVQVGWMVQLRSPLIGGAPTSGTLEIFSDTRGSLVSVPLVPNGGTTVATMPLTTLQIGERISFFINGQMEIEDVLQSDFIRIDDIASVVNYNQEPNLLVPGTVDADDFRRRERMYPLRSDAEPALDYDVYNRLAYKDFSIIKLINNLQDTFNLFFITDAAKKQVTICTEVEYLQSFTQDITQIVDCSGTLEEQVFKDFCPNVRFQFAEDSKDARVKEALEQSQFTTLYGQDEISTPTVDETNECNTTVVAGFAPTLNGAAKLGLNLDVLNYPVMHITDEADIWSAPLRDGSSDTTAADAGLTYEERSEENRNFEMRIAYYEGLVEVDDPRTGIPYRVRYKDEYNPLQQFEYNFVAGRWQFSDPGSLIYQRRLFPLAYQVDSWEADPSRPFLSFVDGETSGNKFLAQGVSLLPELGNNLLEEYYPQTLELYNLRRYFELDVSIGFPALQRLLRFDSFLLFQSRVFGTGQLVLNSIQKFNPKACTATLEFFLRQRTKIEQCLEFADYELDFAFAFTLGGLQVTWNGNVPQQIQGDLRMVTNVTAVSSTGIRQGSVYTENDVIQGQPVHLISGADVIDPINGTPVTRIFLQSQLIYTLTDSTECITNFCMNFDPSDPSGTLEIIERTNDVCIPCESQLAPLITADTDCEILLLPIRILSQEVFEQGVFFLDFADYPQCSQIVSMAGQTQVLTDPGTSFTTTQNYANTINAALGSLGFRASACKHTVRRNIGLQVTGNPNSEFLQIIGPKGLGSWNLTFLSGEDGAIVGGGIFYDSTQDESGALVPLVQLAGGFLNESTQTAGITPSFGGGGSIYNSTVPTPPDFIDPGVISTTTGQQGCADCTEPEP
ncbi:MAG: hypothetical protein AAFO96_03675 [Bacteroidota bacterium]